MDGDPAVEPTLDGFSLFLPLPYRIAIILVAGVWAWGLNLHYLDLVKIDVPALVRYPGRASLHHPPHHASTYQLATLLTIPLAVSLLLFWTITHGSASAVLAWQILPQSYLLFVVGCFVIPIKRMSHAGRTRFLTTLKRISLGGIAEANEGRFGDILLADALTSYAKVLGDLFVSTCMLFSTTSTSTAKPNRGCGGAYMVPLVISIPSIIRLRQCLIEFLRVRRGSGRGQPSQGWGGQHLANALKYSTAFPVIILSALQRGYDPKKIHMSEAGLFRLWLLFVFLNSFYSFYWDVAKDWDLNLFSPSASAKSSSFPSSSSQQQQQQQQQPAFPYGLRRHRFFHSANLYYGAIIFDLLLRCTWSFKLSPHLDHFNDLEGGIFLMEFLEVVRRWMWIFFRVETEWVRQLGERGPGQDDILLGDFGGAGSVLGKIDED